MVSASIPGFLVIFKAMIRHSVRILILSLLSSTHLPSKVSECLRSNLSVRSLQDDNVKSQMMVIKTFTIT